jgi:hypothetical protein
MQDTSRQARAEERRKRATLRRTHLSSEEVDPNPIRGDEAISLVTCLTREGWSLAKLEEPTYARHEIPCRCVPGRLT